MCIRQHKGGDEVQRLFSDLSGLLYQRYTAQSVIKALCSRCAFCQNHMLSELSEKYKESVCNIYLILYVLVCILYLRLVSGMLEDRGAKVLGGAGSAGVNVFIYKPHWSMILSSPPGKKRSLIHSCKIQCPIVLTFLKSLFITLLSFPL